MLTLPNSPQEIIDQIIADVDSNTNLAPSVKASFINALVIALGKALYQTDVQISEAIKQCFPQTATGKYLTDFGTSFNVFPAPATPSTGRITVTGLPGTNVDVGTQFILFNNNQTLEVSTAGTIAANVFTTTNVSIVAAGGVATVTFNNGNDIPFWQTIFYQMPFAISGANEPAFNGNFTVKSIIAPNIITFNINPAATSAPTGSWALTFNSASIAVQSVGTGRDQNAPAYTSGNLAANITNVDTRVSVGAVPIGGGTDIEDEEAYRQRVIFKLRNSEQNFSKAEIERTVRDVPGNTRAWVYGAGDLVKQYTPTSVQIGNSLANGWRQIKVTLPSLPPPQISTGLPVLITGASPAAFNGEFRAINVDPANGAEFLYFVQTADLVATTLPQQVTVPVSPAGFVTVFFVRDNDGTGIDIIPDAGEIATTKDAIVSTIKPGDLLADNVIVLAPAPVVVNVTISGLNPNTTAMREAITANLQNFFALKVELGDIILRSELVDEIINTTDATGARPKIGFALVDPANDVEADFDQLAVLGTVSFT